jgi:hypothetical protein
LEHMFLPDTESSFLIEDIYRIPYQYRTLIPNQDYMFLSD